ncbi:MAG TPA: DUF362 domain-containing protein [Terriglobia bacterium]|nr:DUF362 domain-containing protein [Terriglobia bacterium]
MPKPITRREMLQSFAAAAAAGYLHPVNLFATSPLPTAPVAIARCAAYGPAVRASLATLFDQLGGLERLVKGKTVAVKLNLTGQVTSSLRGMPKGSTYWVHPEVIGSTVSLLGQAGARRIRLLESTLDPDGSLQKFMLAAQWNPRDFASAAPRVEFEDTNYAGPSGQYTRLAVPGGGLLFSAYDVNRSYEDCDVYVSLAKLKEHSTAGVTLSMKNSFGIPPATIYGTAAGPDEPGKVVKGARMMLHDGRRQPPKSSLPEIDPASPRDPGYRVPRVTADLAAARPIHLAIVDGIGTVAGGEGPWVKGLRPVEARLLIAGTNGVTTDAVCTALMGFDPMAHRGTAPFEGCESTLMLAEQLGLGTRDLKRIEVRGVPIAKARVDFRKA